MDKYNLNDVALHNVQNLIFVENDKCNDARIKAIKDGKIDSEIKMWADMQVIYEMLMEQLNQLNN